MIPIKLQCECGQRFAFEVEPVNGRMPSPVTCPACGADSTEAANAAIAERAAPRPVGVAAGGGPLRIALTARPDSPAAPAAPAQTGSRQVSKLLPGQTDRTQAKFEAKAKILWGDPPIQVLAYLRSQGFSLDESAALLQELMQERAATIRGKGIMNIISGIGLICVPIAAFVIFFSIGYIYVKTALVTILVGFYGIWRVIKGAGMVLAPKSEEGDVAEQ